MTAICDAALTFPAHPVHGTQYISVFAHSDEARAAHGGIAFLHGAGQIVTAICDAALTFPAHPVHGTQYISVFAHSDEARGVDERGLAYELHDATMTNLQVNGLSTEFVDGSTSLCSRTATRRAASTSAGSRTNCMTRR